VEICQKEMLSFSTLQQFQGILLEAPNLYGRGAHAVPGRTAQFVDLAISNLSRPKGKRRMISFTIQWVVVYLSQKNKGKSWNFFS
jgi:hypothetical protein